MVTGEGEVIYPILPDATFLILAVVKSERKNNNNLVRAKTTRSSGM